jgi:hypothetical protein
MELVLELFTPVILSSPAGPSAGRAEFATASLLRNGKVLVRGGYDVGIQPVASARLLAID